jgi:hypothetical protein
MWKSGKNSRGQESASRGEYKQKGRVPEQDLGLNQISSDTRIQPSYERPSRITNTQFGPAAEFLRIGTPSMPRFDREADGSLQRASLMSRYEGGNMPVFGTQNREKDEMIRSLFGTEDRPAPESSRITPTREMFSHEKHFRESLTTGRGATMTPTHHQSTTISLSRERRPLFPTNASEEPCLPGASEGSRPTAQGTFGEQDGSRRRTSHPPFSVWEDWLLLSTTATKPVNLSLSSHLESLVSQRLFSRRSSDALRSRYLQVLSKVRKDQIEKIRDAAKVGSLGVYS